MARKPSAQSIRSKQNAVLRYVVSTDVDKTSRDLGVSTDQLKRFLNAKPETVKKNPQQYQKLLSSKPTETAKAKDITLVQRLSGKRLSAAYSRYGKSERTTRAIRYAQVTRQRRKVVENDVVKYMPIQTDKGRVARKQILANMGGESANAVMTQYHKGTITESEAKDILAKLWKNSGVAVQASVEYFDDHS